MPLIAVSRLGLNRIRADRSDYTFATGGCDDWVCRRGLGRARWSYRGWYSLLRSKYGFSFFLLGQEQEPVPEAPPPRSNPQSPNHSLEIEVHEPSLPGVIEDTTIPEPEPGSQEEEELVDRALMGPRYDIPFISVQRQPIVKFPCRYSSNRAHTG
eukprot:201838-Prorocentrum_minimum.AAC.1